MPTFQIKLMRDPESSHPSNSTVGTIGVNALQMIAEVLQADVDSESEDGEKAVIHYEFAEDTPQFEDIRVHLKDHLLVIDESENS